MLHFTRTYGSLFESAALVIQRCLERIVRNTPNEMTSKKIYCSVHTIHKTKGIVILEPLRPLLLLFGSTDGWVS